MASAAAAAVVSVFQEVLAEADNNNINIMQEDVFRKHTYVLVSTFT